MSEQAESKVHIGKTIRSVAQSRNMSVNALAERLGKNYRSIYRMFRKEHLDTALISDLCDVLEHDFFSYFHSVNAAGFNILSQENTRLKEQINSLQEELDHLRRENGLLRQQSPSRRPTVKG